MACFTVPAAEALVTTVAARALRHKEKNEEEKAVLTGDIVENEIKTRFSVKLGWLNRLLWGGTALLAFEHVWHGEVIPVFPFLTAVQNGETAEMLREMGTAGVGMALLVTAVWGVMVGVSSMLEKKALLALPEGTEGTGA